MAVYDIAANLRTATPGTAAMEGKAARIAMRNNAAIAQMNETAAEEDRPGQKLAMEKRRLDQEAAALDAKVSEQYRDFLQSQQEAAREQQRNQWAQGYMAWQGAMEQGNEEAANEIIASTLKATGTSEEQIPAGMEMARTIGPERFFKSRFTDAEEVLSGSDVPADQESFENLIEGFTPEEQALAKRIKAGLKPRAVADTAATLAGPDATPEEVARVRAFLEGGTKAGGQGVTMSGEAFDKLGQVTQSIATIDEALSALDEGANTGTIMSMLPSVREASIALDNVQRRMGLNIIQATTFGSLSEKELDFVLDTAMPQNMDEPDLRKWLQDKKQAQQKLAQELAKMAEFLGTPGNLPSDYIKQMREEGKLKYENDGEDGDNESEVVISAHPKFGDVTEADIQQTMKDTGMSRDEVMERLNGG